MPLERDLEEGQPWVFDEAVADGFDEMLSRSIPEHDRMREAVYEVASCFAPVDLTIPKLLDLGCSRGEAMAPLVADGWAALGLEVSEPMLDAARRRFDGMSHVGIAHHDLRVTLPNVTTRDVILSVLTLMFVPTNYRQRILRDAFEILRPGGALIVVEKVLGHGQLDEVMVDAYHRLKGTQGYSADEIARKQLALEGVLVPLTAAMNEQMLDEAGFRPVDVFWAWFNFRGWVAVRP